MYTYNEMVSLLEFNRDGGRSQLLLKRFTGPWKVAIGQTVYLLTSSDDSTAGVPGMLSALNAKTAKISLEPEHGTFELAVPACDLVPASVFTATLLRAACCACDRLVLDRGSLVGVTQDELADALVLERVSRAIAQRCASLSNEADWASDSVLQAWLRAIRDFYYPRPLSNI